MKTKSETIRVVLFSIFGLLLMYIVYSALNNLSVSRHDSYNVRALFTDLKQLQVGDDVRIAGVRVGSVVNTYLNKGLAVAVLNVEKKYSIPEDSVATILMAGLLGANYISITPGNSLNMIDSSGYLETNKVSDVSSVIQKFSSIGDRLDRILSGFDGSNNGLSSDSPSLFQELGSFFHDNKDKLGNIIDSVSDITGKIASGQGTLGRLICEDQVYDELVNTMQSIKTAALKVDSMLESFNEISKNVQNGEGLLGKLISDPETAKSFDEILKNIQEFTAKLNKEDSTLGRIISNDDLYKQAESAIGKVEKAVDGVSNSGPITAVGTAASALF